MFRSGIGELFYCLWILSWLLHFVPRSNSLRLLRLPFHRCCFVVNSLSICRCRKRHYLALICSWICSILTHQRTTDQKVYNYIAVKGTPYKLYQYLKLKKINPFHPIACRFRVTSHFETSALNPPQMRLNTKKVNEWYSICMI